jgi:uracil-DNA glycosylase
MNSTPATVSPVIDESWKLPLASAFQSESFASLKAFLVSEKRAGKVVFPPGPLIFNAFNSTPLDQVRVVLLGQDPYHAPGQAHGLCFSVPDHVPFPPSLRNIFKELHDDLRIPVPASGNLSKWAGQGVLLLNATLTVRMGEAGSHQNRGWEQFTDSVIRLISEKRNGVIFLLWGKFAQAKQSLIDTNRHHILKSAHPSPLSAYSGFLGCRHFSKVNEILRKTGQQPVDWNPAT